MQILTSAVTPVSFKKLALAAAAAFAFALSFAPSAAETATVAVGANISLRATAEGSPAPTFQWRKGGSAIAGATDATFRITNVTSADAGIFQVTATNTAGSAQSPELTLVVTLGGPGPNITPAIMVHPVAPATAVVGGTVSMTVSASGSPAPTYRWLKNGVTISGATNATLTLIGITTNDSASYTAIAGNVAGSAISNPVTLVVIPWVAPGQPPPPTNPPPPINIPPPTNTPPPTGTPPAITALRGPAQAVTVGGTVSFAVAASGSPAPSYRWLKNGFAISGATNATLILVGVTTSDSAIYAAVASNLAGSATSNAVTLVVAPVSPPPQLAPVFTVHPFGPGTATAGGTVSMTVSASGSPAPTYRWLKNGVAMSGATNPTLTLVGIAANDSANYTVIASNVAGSAASDGVTLNVTPLTPEIIPPSTSGSRIVNLSARATAGADGSNLIVGFVINGNATKPMLIRGVGPTLAGFGVPGALLDPTISLYSGPKVTAVNDDWRTNDNALQIVWAGVEVGAFSLLESGADSALLTALEPGAYTVQLRGKDAASGVALIEVYDAAPANSSSLVNLAVRTYVGAGADAPNLGFVISDGEAKRVLIRAVGPTLGVFGVLDALADPQLELFRGAVRIDQNDDWGGSEALVSTFAQVGAFLLNGSGSRDAALLVTLEPGAYTVVASGAGGSTGVALVEVYDVP